MTWPRPQQDYLQPDPALSTRVSVPATRALTDADERRAGAVCPLPRRSPSPCPSAGRRRAAPAVSSGRTAAGAPPLVTARAAHCARGQGRGVRPSPQVSGDSSRPARCARGAGPVAQRARVAAGRRRLARRRPLRRRRDPAARARARTVSGRHGAVSGRTRDLRAGPTPPTTARCDGPTEGRDGRLAPRTTKRVAPASAGTTRFRCRARPDGRGGVSPR